MKLPAWRSGWWMGPVLAAVAGAVYAYTLAPGAFPGESAHLMAQNAGLTTATSLSNPLWGMLVELLARLAPHHLALPLNLFSLFCAVAVVWLVYSILAGATREIIDEGDIHEERLARNAAVLAGTGGALFLAFCVPFWAVANRAHPLSFDVLLLVGVTVLFRQFNATGKISYYLLFGFLYGVGIVEYEVFVLFAPLFIVGVLIALWRHEKLGAGALFEGLLVVVLGLLLYLLAAWRFTLSESYAALEFTGYWKALWNIWKSQYVSLTQSLPQFGWLVVLMATVVPWLTSMLVCRRGLNDERGWTFHLLHVVMTAVAMAVLFNSRISPWTLTGFWKLLVTPYVLLACTYGYLVAYWYLVPSRRRSLSETPNWLQRWITRWLGSVSAFALLVTVVVGGVLNFKRADARCAGPVRAFAGQVIRDLEGRRWLVTDGVWDDQFRIAARDAGARVDLLNLALGASAEYRRVVASRFAESRLKSMAQVSLLAFLQEWLRTDPTTERTVAVLNLPDLWYAAGKTVVPNRTVYWGAAPGAVPDPAPMLARHEEVWKAQVPELLRTAEESGPEGQWYASNILRHVSMLGNNLGVLLEDQGRPQDAFRAYEQARVCDSNNLSALLNQYAIVRRGQMPEARKAIESVIEEVQPEAQKRHRIWSLARTYGYVRLPEAFADLGWSWALSGQPGLAASGLRRAIDLGERGQDTLRFKEALATVYLTQDRAGESMDLYKQVLEKNPNSPQSVIGAARAAVRTGDFTAAEEYLTRAEKAGAPRQLMALEWASVYMAAGKPDRAQVVLQELVDLNPHDYRAWTLLGWLHLLAGNQLELDTCLKTLEDMERVDYGALVLRGEAALRRHKFQQARKHFEKAVELGTGQVALYEKLLQIDQLTGHAEGAERHVEQLLTLDPGNAVGNYVLGSLQFRRSQFKLAESSLRKSLEGGTRSPLALNDLAWILQERKDYEEAEALAREALQKAPQMTPAWDTLGVILMRTRRYDEAEKAFGKAIGLDREYLAAAVHLAELYVEKGEKEKALTIINTVLNRLDELSVEDRNRLERLRARVREPAPKAR